MFIKNNDKSFKMCIALHVLDSVNLKLCLDSRFGMKYFEQWETHIQLWANTIKTAVMLPKLMHAFRILVCFLLNLQFSGDSQGLF